MMKLKTSYFNSTVLRKDLSRFAPVWGLYTLGLFLIMSTFYNYRPDRMASNLAETMGAFSYINCAYAFLSATVLFGDLFQSRMCNALHAMPMRRSGWFLTHFTAGILFALIPTLLLATVAGILLQEYILLSLLWFLGIMGQYLFHFALAVLCAMCVGSRFAHALVYGIGNFLALIVYWFASIFYEPLLYGITLDTQMFIKLCPTTWLGQGNFFLWDGAASTTYFRGLAVDKWIYLAVCVGLGILMLLLALLVYRRRKLETAGDFISFRALSPVFLLLYTLIAGTVFYTFGDIFTSNAKYIFLFIGILTGFFTGRMLLERSLKVFRWKSILACFLLLVVFSGTLAVTYLDPMGLTRWVPDTADIESTSIDISGSYYGKQTMTDPADIESVTAIHENLLTKRTQHRYGYYIGLSYTLKNGHVVTREYFMESINPELEAKLTPMLSRWELVMKGNTLEYLLENTFHILSSTTDNLPAEAYRELLEAIAQDCEAGNMAQSYALHQDEKQKHWLEINYTIRSGVTNHLYLDIFKSCNNTISVLEKYASEEYMEKFTD